MTPSGGGERRLMMRGKKVGVKKGEAKWEKAKGRLFVGGTTLKKKVINWKNDPVEASFCYEPFLKWDYNSRSVKSEVNNLY